MLNLRHWQGLVNFANCFCRKESRQDHHHYLLTSFTFSKLTHVMPHAAKCPFKSSKCSENVVEKKELALCQSSEHQLKEVFTNTHSRYSHSHREQSRDGANSSNQTKCEFNSVNVRLLETFGFIGTAVAVGIDVRSRINEWMPLHNQRRTIHDFCHNHHHYHWHPSLSPAPTLPRVPCYENNSNQPTFRFCASCPECSTFFDGFFKFFLTGNSIYQSTIQNIVSKHSPQLNHSHRLSEDSGHASDQSGLFESTNSTTIDRDATADVDECDGLLKINNDGSLHLKSNQECTSLLLQDDETKLQCDSIQTYDQVDCGSEQLDHHVRSDSSDTTALSISPDSSSDLGQAECDNDIVALFRVASIEYTDQLNNLVAISLMNGHQPDEAMRCWSSCEASSRAFFNMGVAYESGRHAKDAKPDLDRAHDCYALAASMGHREAIYNLALFYLYGKGKIEADVERGIKLLQMAASKGVEAAQRYCFELERHQQKEEMRRRVLLASTASATHSRTRYRPSASLFGPTSRLTPKHLIGDNQDNNRGALRRNNSAPNLVYQLNQPFPSSTLTVTRN